MNLTAFFVDSVLWPSSDPAGVGNGYGILAEIGYVRSSFYGAELIAHETAHSLGLSAHHPSPSNLMYETLSGGTALTSSQADILLASSFLQPADIGYTVEIIPVWISSTPYETDPTPPDASAVPVPAAGVLLLGAILPFAGRSIAGRRRAARHNGVRDGDGREAAAPGHARDRTGAIRTVSRRAAGPRSCACSRTRLRRLRAPRSIRRRR